MIMRHRHSATTLWLLALISLMLAACGGETTTVEEHFQQGNEYAQNGEFDKAIAEYEAVLDKEPDNVSALSNLGVVYYNTGELDKAISQYEKAIDLSPEDADIHSNLAAAYVQREQLDKALELYLAAIELNPELIEAIFGLGVVYFQLGQNDMAIDAFEQFQELDTGRDLIATEQAEQYLQQLRGQ
jgi:tetratricopeptide (TPR) repeat protein